MRITEGRKWAVLVLTKAGCVLQNTPCDDEKHCQGVATIARSEDMRTVIKILPPAGEPRLWD